MEHNQRILIRLWKIAYYFNSKSNKNYRFRNWIANKVFKLTNKICYVTGPPNDFVGDVKFQQRDLIEHRF